MLDGLVWMPVVFLVAYASSVSLRWGFLLFPFGLVSFAVYQIAFHARYGATVGKMAMRLRVVRAVDGSSIDANVAIKRSFVDAVLRLSMATLAAQALHVYGGTLPNDDVLALLKILQARESYERLSNLSTLWAITEIFACLFHPLRRSLHDFIAGTIVIRLPKA